MQKELTARIDTPLELAVSDVLNQVQKIHDIMRKAMKDGIHYGAAVPGSDRRSLLKAGAEKLLMTFRLAPAFDIRRFDLSGGHREYEITATLRHVPTDLLLSEGVGSASTLESKYRFRWENTSRTVPAEYWRSRDPALLGGADFVPRKVDGKWWIFHRVEHDNPADYYNTILKIGKKRALVDAVLSATAASDVFTHEAEDDDDDDGEKDPKKDLFG